VRAPEISAMSFQQIVTQYGQLLLAALQAEDAATQRAEPKAVASIQEAELRGTKLSPKTEPPNLSLVDLRLPE